MERERGTRSPPRKLPGAEGDAFRVNQRGSHGDQPDRPSGAAVLGAGRRARQGCRSVRATMSAVRSRAALPKS